MVIRFMSFCREASILGPDTRNRMFLENIRMVSQALESRSA